MEDLFKKFIYTGVGFAALTAEKFQKAVDGLVDDGKISAEEGKKIVGELVENTDTKREEFEGKLKSIVEDVVSRFTFVRKDELEALQHRVSELEARLAAAPKSDDEADEKKAAKKSTTKTAEA